MDVKLYEPELKRPISTEWTFVSMIIGVILPLACLLFDRRVFHADGYPGRVAIPWYVGTAISLFALFFWLIPQAQFPGPMVGFLFGGGMFAFALGMFLLPYAIMGIAFQFLFGYLCLVPFVTAVTFWTNANLAWRLAEQRSSKGMNVLFLLFGLLLSCGFPWALFLAMCRAGIIAFEE